MARDFYSVLGVSKGADADTLKKSYKKLARELHPDKNQGNAQAEARFKEVNAAYDVLSDPKRRALYDEFGEDGLREGFDPARARAYSQWGSHGGGARVGGDPFGGGGFGGGVNLEDLFGGAGGDPFEAFRRGGGRRRGPVKGGDVEASVRIDFASAVRGTTLDFTAPIHNVPVKVRIPAGAETGSKLRVPGYGQRSPNGGPDGDLLLVVDVEPHPYFRREGADLHVDVPVGVGEAYRGAKVRVPTVDGAANVSVPPKTKSGAVLRVKGKGVQRKGKEPGDLYVHLLVQLPAGDDPKIGELVDALAALQTDDLRGHLAL